MQRRRRTGLAVVFGVTVAAGVLSRTFPLPGLFAEYTGDALYAAAWFWLLAWLAPRWRATALALSAWLVCATIEVSQLVDKDAPGWEWLAALRAGWGRWIMGQGFQVADLIAYAIGTLLAATCDRVLPRHTT